MLYSYGIDKEHPYNDFRLFALPQFRTLSSLCILASKTWADSLTVFQSKLLISKQAQSYEAVYFQAQTAIDQFHLSTMRTFVRMLDFIRHMAQGNGIVSSLMSNWYFHTLSKISESSFWSSPRAYGERNSCSCVTNSMCTSPAAVNETLIPGFLIGCYVLDALLQSTLECLYNITCIEKIQSLYTTQNIVIRPLNNSLSSPNETVKNLIDTLLIDRFETNISYQNYYIACSPLSCTYSTYDRVNPIEIITVIIGLYGGLTVALKLLTPVLVKIGLHINTYRQRRITPVTAPDPTSQ